MQTGEFVALRLGSSSSEDGNGRLKTRRFAKRSRSGCITCRRRHIRCDEAKPACERCTKSKVSCIYASRPPPTRTLTTEGAPRSPLSVYQASQEHIDHQFWVEIGARNIGQWHSSVFHEQLLPQFSQAHESTRYAMLALSTCVHQWHLSDMHAREKALLRGNRYYSLACEKLITVNESKISIEAALVCSLALFSYDTFSDRLGQRDVHSGAALSLLNQMKQGLTYNEVSGWRSESSKVGAQIVIGTADSWFNEISFPTSDEHPKEDNEHVDASQASRTKLYVPFWLEFDTDSAVLAGDTMLLKPDAVRSPCEDWKMIHAAPTDVQECHEYLTTWHSWLLTWVINTPLSRDYLQMSQSLCRQWHTWLFGSMRPPTTMMQSMQNRALVLDEMFELKLLELEGFTSMYEVRSRVDRIIRRISSNVAMSGQIARSFDEESPAHTQDLCTRQYLRGWGKAIEYLHRKIKDPAISERALSLFRFIPGTDSATESREGRYTGRAGV